VVKNRNTNQCGKDSQPDKGPDGCFRVGLYGLVMVFELWAECLFLKDDLALVTLRSAGLSDRKGGDPKDMGILLVYIHLDAVPNFAAGVGFNDSGGGQ